MIHHKNGYTATVNDLRGIIIIKKLSYILLFIIIKRQSEGKKLTNGLYRGYSQ